MLKLLAKHDMNIVNAGHGPYSHAYDMIELEGPHEPENLKSHEYRSAAILDMMTEVTIFDKHGMIPSHHIPGYKGEARQTTEYTDLQFIKDLITFSEDYKKAKDKRIEAHKFSINNNIIILYSYSS